MIPYTSDIVFYGAAKGEYGLRMDEVAAVVAKMGGRVKSRSVAGIIGYEYLSFILELPAGVAREEFDRRVKAEVAGIFTVATFPSFAGEIMILAASAKKTLDNVLGRLPPRAR